MVTRRQVRQCIYLLLGCTFLSGMLTGIYWTTRVNPDDELDVQSKPQWLNTEIDRDQKWFGLGGSQLIQKLRPLSGENSSRLSAGAHNRSTYNINGQKIDPFKMDTKFNVSHAANKALNTEFHGTSDVNYNVHVFYYMWYGNPRFDGKYLHWNHNRLPHWDKQQAERWPTDSHKPPDDIGANFYPQLGPYSSQDPEVMENHMQQIRTSGAGVLAVSWYPPTQGDDNGIPWDRYIPQLMDIAHKYLLKICFHIEPFKDRTAASVKHWIEYIITTYGSHPAFYRYKTREKLLPLFYLYDSYQVSSGEWSQLLNREGGLSVRGTEFDGVFIGLLVENIHKQDLKRAGFDGFYTYFASSGFSYGSSPTTWNMIARDAKKNRMLFIPSVGPGYVDDRVRPWNKHNTKSRDKGKYYEHMFELAIGCNPPIISITSFNEWHEGTQIETAVPKTDKDFKYLDYKPNGTEFYLQLTRKWARQFRNT